MSENCKKNNIILKRAKEAAEAEYYRKIVSCCEPTQIEKDIKNWLDRGFPFCAINPTTGKLRM